jgi:hypothetical protein
MDGLAISNFTTHTFKMDTTEDNDCNSNNLKGVHDLIAGQAASFDVSGHLGDSCINTVHLKYADGTVAAKFTFTMSDGDPAYIQDFSIAPGSWDVAVSVTNPHNISVSPKR